MLKGFLTLAMWLAMKNDVLSTDTFGEKEDFNNFFFLHVHLFFLLKNCKGLSFNAGCLASIWQSDFESFMASLDSWSPYFIQSQIGDPKSPVAMN